MEEYVTKLVDNTFENHSFEEAKKIIIDKILWYEMKILKLQEGDNK